MSLQTRQYYKNTNYNTFTNDTLETINHIRISKCNHVVQKGMQYLFEYIMNNCNPENVSPVLTHTYSTSPPPFLFTCLVPFYLRV